jgi:hypothetical protein
MAQPRSALAGEDDASIAQVNPTNRNFFIALHTSFLHLDDDPMSDRRH